MSDVYPVQFDISSEKVEPDALYMGSPLHWRVKLVCDSSTTRFCVYSYDQLETTRLREAFSGRHYRTRLSNKEYVAVTLITTGSKCFLEVGDDDNAQQVAISCEAVRALIEHLLQIASLMKAENPIQRLKDENAILKTEIARLQSQTQKST
jgi:hypothetical protein